MFSLCMFGDNEHVFYACSNKSCFKCEACTKLLRMTRNNDTSLRPQCTLSASHATCPKSDGGGKVISPEREPHLPDLGDSEPLSVQLDSARLSRTTAMDAIENLLSVVSA